MILEDQENIKRRNTLRWGDQDGRRREAARDRSRSRDNRNRNNMGNRNNMDNRNNMEKDSRDQVCPFGYTYYFFFLFFLSFYFLFPYLVWRYCLLQTYYTTDIEAIDLVPSTSSRTNLRHTKLYVYKMYNNLNNKLHAYTMYTADYVQQRGFTC